MFFDYPSVSDSSDSDMSPAEAELAYATKRVEETMAKLADLAAEGDGYTVLGRYYGLDIDVARRERTAEIEKRTRDLARFTSHVAALTIELCRDDAA